MRRQDQSDIAPVQTADVLKHLGDSLNMQWRRYRKRLKRCQKRFSNEAVHDVRVETRRLLSTIELLGAFIPEPDIKKVRRALKRHLDTFDQLRDTQVQLGYVGRMAGTFPDAHEFLRLAAGPQGPFHPDNAQSRQTYQDEAAGPMSGGV